MSDFPKFVEFHEEGVREGFQMEPLTYPRERRVALLNALSGTGLRQIQVGSLVNPRKVPQMADTLELFAEIERRPGVRYTLLWLNESGYQKARTVQGAFNHAPLMYYLTDAFAMRNLAHGEGGIEAAVAHRDHHALIGLETLTVAFLDLDLDLDGVAGAEFGNLLGLGGNRFGFELLDDVHG